MDNTLKTLKDDYIGKYVSLDTKYYRKNIYLVTDVKLNLFEYVFSAIDAITGFEGTFNGNSFAGYKEVPTEYINKFKILVQKEQANG